MLRSSLHGPLLKFCECELRIIGTSYAARQIQVSAQFLRRCAVGEWDLGRLCWMAWR